LLIYDSSDESWSEGPDLPPEYPSVEGLTMSTYLGHLYVFGGRTHVLGSKTRYEVVNSAAKYQPILKKWTMLNDMPTPRSGAGAVTIDTRIYIVGGSTSDGDSLNTVESYHAITGVWKTLNVLQVPRNQAGVVAINRKIYVFGGSSSDNQVFDSVEIYDPIFNTWTLTSPNMPTPRKAVLVTSVNDRAIVMGGEAHHKILSSNEMYDTSSNEWYELDPLPSPRSEAAGGRIGNQVFVVGGMLKNRKSTSSMQVFVL